MQHELKAGRGVTKIASDAARSAFEAGGSPRAQIDAARMATGQRLNYAPHQGAKERAKRLAQLQKAQAKKD